MENENKTLLENLKKEKVQKIYNDLHSDYINCRYYSKEWFSKIEQWRKEYFGKPYGNEVEGKSKIVSRDIKKFSEWLQSSILDPFVSTPDIIRCNPINAESIKSAQSAELILNSQFCRQMNRYNFLAKALKVLDVEGTCIIKTGWEYKEEERFMTYLQEEPVFDQLGNPIIDPNTGEALTQPKQIKRKENVILFNRPTADICRNQDIFLDPTCLGNVENMQFIIHRFEADYSTLKSDGRYSNLDKLQFSTGQDFEGDYRREANRFEFQDKARKKVLVYEYWGNYDIEGNGNAEPIVCSWVDGVVIRFDRNPYPDKKPPFIIAPFLPIPFELYGESNGELLSDIQKVKTAITRGFLDNMAASNNGQIGIRTGTIDETNKRLMLAGKNFQFNGSPQDIYVGSYNQLPQSAFSILQMYDNEAQSLTGVITNFGMQTTNMIGENNASSRGVLDGGNLRKLMIVKSVSENLIKPLLRKWLEYNAELLDEETQIRMSNNQFEIIRRDDLYGQIELDLQISTNEDNAVKARELAFLLQTIGPSEDPEIRKMLMSQIAKLHKMPELALQIENYQPQPDPMQQAMMQAQIENLNAQTDELRASSGRIQSDTELKYAKIPVEQAKAQNIGSQTDLKNLTYAQQQQGIDRANDMEKFNKKLQGDIQMERAKMQFQTFKDLLQQNLNKDQQKQYKKQKPKTAYSPSTATISNRNPYNTDVPDDTI